MIIGRMEVKMEGPAPVFIGQNWLQMEGPAPVLPPEAQLLCGR